jgi:hypothetical protein
MTCSREMIEMRVVSVNGNPIVMEVDRMRMVMGMITMTLKRQPMRYSWEVKFVQLLFSCLY